MRYGVVPEYCAVLAIKQVSDAVSQHGLPVASRIFGGYLRLRWHRGFSARTCEARPVPPTLAGGRGVICRVADQGVLHGCPRVGGFRTWIGGVRIRAHGPIMVGIWIATPAEWLAPGRLRAWIGQARSAAHNTPGKGEHR